MHKSFSVARVLLSAWPCACNCVRDDRLAMLKSDLFYNFVLMFARQRALRSWYTKRRTVLGWCCSVLLSLRQARSQVHKLVDWVLLPVTVVIAAS